MEIRRPVKVTILPTGWGVLLTSTNFFSFFLFITVSLSVRSTGDETTRDKSDVAVAHACNAAPRPVSMRPMLPSEAFPRPCQKLGL